MDRFFSKLDLRDIKVDPESKFPPGDDEFGDDDNDRVDEWGTTEMSAATTMPSDSQVSTVVDRQGEVLKVSARSRPSAVAGAIAGVVRESGRAEVQAIGAGATNQAVKAVAIARDYLRETDIEAVCLPAFIDVTIDDEDRTAIRIIVEPR